MNKILLLFCILFLSNCEQRYQKPTDCQMLQVLESNKNRFIQSDVNKTNKEILKYRILCDKENK